MQQFAVATKEFLGKKEITPPKNLATAHMLDSPYGEDWEILFPSHCGGMSIRPLNPQHQQPHPQ
jgi:hypothetical protein